MTVARASGTTSPSSDAGAFLGGSPKRDKAAVIA